MATSDDLRTRAEDVARQIEDKKGELSAAQGTIRNLEAEAGQVTTNARHSQDAAAGLRSQAEELIKRAEQVESDATASEHESERLTGEIAAVADSMQQLEKEIADLGDRRSQLDQQAQAAELEERAS